MNQAEQRTIKQWRQLCQSSAPDPANETLAGRSARVFSIYFTKYLVKTNLTPNKITAIGTIIYLVGVGLYAFGIYWLSIVGFALLYFSTILDACDGEVFRYRKYKSGYGGTYVEPLTHDIMYGLMFLPIAYGGFVITGNPLILLLGGVAGIFKVLFRLTESRFFYGVTRLLPGRGQIDKTKNFKEKSPSTKLIFRLYRNTCTSTGILIPLLILTILNRPEIFVAFYAFAFLVLWLSLFARQMLRFKKISQQVIDRHKYFLDVKKRTPHKKIIVFDLDGTLLDTMGIFADIASYLISWKYKIPRVEARENYLKTSGIPFFQQLEVMFPGNSNNAEVAKLFEERKVHATDHLEMPEEDKNLLRSFSDSGYGLAVSSNNFQENVDQFVQFSNIDFLHALGYRERFAKGEDHFNFIMTNNRVGKEELIFVGDSISDMKTTMSCGIDFIGKLGTFKSEDFEAEFPNAITVRNLKELTNIL